MSRKLSIQAVLAAAVVGAALLTSPAAAFASQPVVWGPGQLQPDTADKCLDDPGPSTANGTQMDIYQCEDGAQNELWKVELPPGYDGVHYWIVNAYSNKCLTVKGGVSTIDEPIIQYDCNTNPNEEWVVNYQTYGYSIITARNDGMCLTVEGNGYANKTPIIQYPCTSPWGNQDWGIFG